MRGQATLVKYAPKSLIVASIIYFISRISRNRRIGVAKEEAVPVATNKDNPKVGVDRLFWTQFKYLIKICIPSWKCKTVGILCLHTIFLVMRTYLTVVVARIDGRLVKDLVNGDGKSFLRTLTIFMGIAFPATYINSMIKYLQSKFAISLRTTLTKHVHGLYMSNNTYYKAINLDSRIDGADQLITTDINKFCNALANLYSNLGKPLLDIIIFNYQLSRSIGMTGMWGLTLNYIFTATVLKSLTPPFGKLAADEAKLEGDFRTAHSRLITNAEEIGFYNGENLEKSILDKTYSRLIKHVNSIYRIRIGYNMFEDFIIKYTWSAVGLLMASIPVFFPESAGSRTKRDELNMETAPSLIDGLVSLDAKTGSRTIYIIRLMVSLADAGGRIMYSYKELSELAGYTYRVHNMLRVFEDLSENQFQTLENTNGVAHSLLNINGTRKVGNKVEFALTDIVTPMGDTILIESLTLKIESGEHLMITGPNGSGKSSILRTLAGLWPQFTGSIVCPGPENIFYIPQKPYLAIGTLREQVIYPHSVADMIKEGKNDLQLGEILKIVCLDYIPQREGGWGAIKEWKDVLSGGITMVLQGEKQRMQLARLFYHRPQYAVLDEATSAVSNDVESLIYNSAKEHGITIITISHRPALFKYHQYLLKVGEGSSGQNWELKQIGTHESLSQSVEVEAKKLEKELAEMASLKARLKVVNKELGLNMKNKDTRANRYSAIANTNI